MSIRLYSQVQTPPIYELSTIIDAGLASCQAAVTATVFSLASASTGAIISFVFRIVYKTLASHQTALTATFFSMGSAGIGAIIGFTLRIAYKINEWALNGIFNQIGRNIGRGLGLSLLRKVVEVFAAAAVVSVAFLLIPAISLNFSTFLALSALENLRPIRQGGCTMRGTVVDKGLSISISCK